MKRFFGVSTSGVQILDVPIFILERNHVDAERIPRFPPDLVRVGEIAAFQSAFLSVFAKGCLENQAVGLDVTDLSAAQTKREGDPLFVCDRGILMKEITAIFIFAMRVKTARNQMRGRHEKKL